MSRVAKRYTKAIFELAQEQKIIDVIEKDFVELGKLIGKSPEFADFLSNPLISEAKKISLLKEILNGKIQELTLHFLELLASKRRLRVLPEIIEEFRQMMLESQNIVEGELISAVQLSAEQVKAIKERLQQALGKTVQLEQKVEPQIIGGFVVRVQDVVIDSSIRLQLEKLREKLTAR